MAVAASSDALLLQDFVNTRDLRSFVPRGHPHRDGTRDDLASPELLAAWLADHGLTPRRPRVSTSDHARVLELRTTLRAALEGGHGRAEGLAPFTAPLRVEIDPLAGPTLTTAGRGVDSAVGAICAAALRASLTGEWWRLRACAAEDCQWVFFDGSKPGRGRYCSPDACGNRVKTRAYRQRRAESPAGQRP
jgi:predicted RNA-binding Zn ribbon-like protein